MMRATATTIGVLLSLSLAMPGWSADYSDPTWPCIQRKVERLSPGLMWPHPIEEMELDEETRASIDDLVGRLVLRRVELAEVEPVLAEFVAAHGNSEQLLGQVFTETFDALSGTRRKIMSGIEDYSLKQIGLSERVDEARIEMDRLMEADEPDFDRVDELEAQIDWDERIYTDRQKSLTYVCETPVLLEKRLYSIAQMLLDHVGS